MLRRNRSFRDRTRPFDTDIRWRIGFFEESQVQTRRHRDHNRQYWEVYCYQQPHWCLKSRPLLKVLVARSYFSIGGGYQNMCGELIGMVQDRPVRSPPFIFIFLLGAFCHPTLTLAVILPRSSLWLLAVKTSHIQMPLFLTKLLLCSQRSLPFTSSFVSGSPWLSKKWKSRRKIQNQQQQKSMLQTTDD